MVREHKSQPWSKPSIDVRNQRECIGCQYKHGNPTGQVSNLKCMQSGLAVILYGMIQVQQSASCADAMKRNKCTGTVNKSVRLKISLICDCQ
ncbi:hypothetical protein P692DRAFT_2048622 [Suillus brevipes Sb2]|nr:hypothetical protein P692DRAFT_2048622 [Suillus brevipes Sb2]